MQRQYGNEVITSHKTIPLHTDKSSQDLVAREGQERIEKGHINYSHDDERGGGLARSRVR